MYTDLPKLVVLYVLFLYLTFSQFIMYMLGSDLLHIFMYQEKGLVLYNVSAE